MVLLFDEDFSLSNKTRHASKGVISLILPDELRPYCQETKEPVDFVYNPFG